MADFNTRKLIEQLSQLITELQPISASMRDLTAAAPPAITPAALAGYDFPFAANTNKAIDLLRKSIEDLTPPLNQVRTLQILLRDEQANSAVNKLGASQTIAVLQKNMDETKTKLIAADEETQQLSKLLADEKTRFENINIENSVQRAQLESRLSEISRFEDQLAVFSAVSAKISAMAVIIDEARASLVPMLTETKAAIQSLDAAVQSLTSTLENPPSNAQQTADMTQVLESIKQLVTKIPESIRTITITAPVANVSPPQATVPPPNITVSAPEVKAAIDNLITLIRAGGASAIANGTGTGQVTGQDPSPPTPSDFEEKRDTAVAALQKVIAEYKNYVRNAGDAVPYLKRPYRAEVYYDSNETYDAADPSKRRFKTRGVLALVPCREFSNILATGCGAIGQAITALANARSARARAHVQHPHAALGVLRMNTVVVGHPAGPASRGVVPLDAPGHLAMALHDDIAAAEIALRQAYHELEGKLSPYEAFRVFPPGDARRYVPVPTDPTEVDDAFRRAAGLEVTLAIDRPTDVEAMFRHAASLEVTLALDRILTRVHVRSESCWPLQGVNPFDTIDALAKHVYGIITPRTQPSKETLDKERREVESLARQVAEHEERQREARIYREAREAAREAELEAARLARHEAARLVARV